MFRIGDIVVRVDGDQLIMSGSVPQGTIFYLGFFLVLDVRMGYYMNNRFALCQIMDSDGDTTWAHQASFKLICRLSNE